MTRRCALIELLHAIFEIVNVSRFGEVLVVALAIALVSGLGQKKEKAGKQEHGWPRWNTGVTTYESDYRVIPDATPAFYARTLILKIILQQSKQCAVAHATNAACAASLERR